MILKQAYIRAFGNLKDLSISFDPNLNSYCEKNGFGKTTITAFVKGMFYGLGQSISKKKFKERERYLPFSESDSGGSLTFAIGEDVYRIERSFQKRAADDTCFVYKNNSRIEMNCEPGDYFFKINADSFDKTMFLYPIDLTISSNEDINSKMANYFLNDEMDCEKVLSSLNDKKRAYRASRGDGGLLNEKKREIADLQTKNVELENQKHILEEKENEKKEIIEEIREKEEEAENAKEEEGKRRILQQVEESKTKVEKAKKEYDDFLAQYSNQIPTREEYNSIKDVFYERQKKESLIPSLSNEENEELDNLNQFFSLSYPKEEVMNQIYDDIHQLESLKEEKEESDEERKILQLFENHPFVEEPFENYKEKKYQLSICPETEMKTVLKEGKRNKTYLYIALCLFLLTSLLSFFLGWFVNPIGYMLFLLAFSLLFSFLLIFNKSKKEEKEIVIAENEKYKVLLKECFDLEKECQRILKSFNKEGVDILKEYDSLKEDYQQYELLLKLRKEREERNSKIREKKADLDKRLSSFFESYPISHPDYKEKFKVLREKKTLFDNLNRKKEEIKIKSESIKKEISLLDLKLFDFEKKYDCDINQVFLLELDDILQEETKKKQTYEVLANNLESLKREKGIDSISMTETFVSYEEAVKEKEELLKKQNTINLEIEQLKDAIFALEEKVISLEDKKKEYQTLSEEYFFVSKTIDFIAEAKESLKKKYIDPMKDSFDFYAKKLKIDDSKIEFDKDFNLSLLEAGSLRNIKHLSLGQTTLCLLCYRLALIDNIFPNEKNFIILDDILVNLDEGNLKVAMDFVKDISQDRQVFYFTCHPSRKI